ncbi:hypothetical protein DSECCO2_433990 [anaerobic digester metagenome]
MTQANSNEPLPLDSASFLNDSMMWGATAPVSKSNRPTVVDFPWSMCPITAKFMWGFSTAIDCILHSNRSVSSNSLLMRVTYTYDVLHIKYFYARQ